MNHQKYALIPRAIQNIILCPSGILNPFQFKDAPTRRNYPHLRGTCRQFYSSDKFNKPKQTHSKDHKMLPCLSPLQQHEAGTEF